MRRLKRKIRTRHCAVDGRVRARNERAVALDVLRDIRGAVAQRVLVEDAEVLVDRPACVLGQKRSQSKAREP